MDDLVACAFFLGCLGLLGRLLKARDVVDYQMGVLAAFSVGYYCLPVWFKESTPLAQYEGDTIAVVLLIFLLFGLSVTCGTWIGRGLVPLSVRLRTDLLDEILSRRRLLVSGLAFGIYLYYYSSQQLTSYSSQSFESYFSDRGPFYATIATLADVCLGLLAVNVAGALHAGERRQFLLISCMLGTCIVLLAFVGQRLAFLTPIAMLMAGLALTEQFRRARRMLLVGVVALLLISPIAIAIRQSQSTSSAQDAVKSFSYGDTPVETVFQSIVDRGDLVYVAAGMKRRIDADSPPGWIYYSSVLINPIPSWLMPGVTKPYLLSSNGEPSGELSIYAWRSLHGSNTGSLTAFGGLVAYRELGWMGVIVNGVATGGLFIFLARWLGAGGVLVSVYYANLFVSLSVKKVPPSFWEALSALMPMLPMLLLVYFVELVLRARSSRSLPRASARS